MSEKYFVGLDMGTNSVGWAVTDDRYHLIRKKGKDMWGARLFDEAEPAAGRRTARVARRRLERQKARIGYLKMIFAPYLEKVDPGFLTRLEDSKFFEEDKTVKQKYALFADKEYTDKDYLKQYPTIFHLRKELLESDREHDIRLVFLAVLNIFHHRGHFLNPGLKDGSLGDIDQMFTALDENLENLFPDKGWKLGINTNEQGEILSSKKLTSSGKLEAVLKLLNIEKNDKAKKPLVEIIKLLCGLKGVLKVIFDDAVDDSNAKFSISFRDANFDEKIAEAEGFLGEEYIDALLCMKQLHDWGVLAGIMKSGDSTHPYISYAKVESYEKHKSDLKLLKRVIKRIAPEEYDNLFRIEKDTKQIKENSYSAYIGSANHKNIKLRRGVKDTAFFDELKKLILKKSAEKDEECEYIINEIEKGSFLPKMLTNANGVVPNQIYRTELKQILDNASNYLTFLNDKNDDGSTTKERIIQIFSFQIPYYVGPLKKSEGSNAWVVRKAEGKVYPWNFEEKIDMRKTNEEFIRNMVKYCSYIDGEKVLPQNSLLFEKFKVLNELNNLTVSGEKISVELKQDIYRDLFRKKGKKVTTKDLLTYLKEKSVISTEDNEECLGGYDKQLGCFMSSLTNYGKFKAIFDTEVLTDSQTDMAEDIIYYSTIYGDAKSYLKKLIKEKYSDILSEKQIDRITGIKFKDWATISKEFLLLKGPDKSTGEELTIISTLWNTNQNLMQIINNPEYGFKEQLEEKGKKLGKTLSEVTYEDIADSYLSAPVRRMVWQAIRILQEITEVMGSEPERVFVEMTRHDATKGDKGRKHSRKKKLEELYKKCKDDEKMFLSEIQGKDERDFRIKKLYLFYMQKGKCMYSGNDIDISKLYDDNYYDIDHIYPRHYVKDDSLENNLVLVESKYNRDKSDELLGADIRKRMHGLWHILHEQQFINDEKYRRLTRKEIFTDEEFAYFIERQMVETGQGTREITRLLNEVMNNDGQKVIYVKAGLVSQFRKANADAGFPAFVKSRVLNDHHHAKDAYLNIVVGNTYYTKFTTSPINYIKELKNKNKPGKNDGYHMDIDRLFARTTERGGYTAWDPDIDRDTVRNTIIKNSAIITKRSYVEKGQLSDLQLVPAKTIAKVAGKGYLPIKSTDNRLINTSRYGGYNSVKTAYFFLVEHTVKGKRIRSIETMYVYLAGKIADKTALEEYCRANLGYVDPDVRLEKIPVYSLLKINGFPVYLTGRYDDVRLRICNARQLTFKDYTLCAYTKAVSKALDEKDTTNEYLEEREKKGASGNEIIINKTDNIRLYDELTKKHTVGEYKNRANGIGDILKKGREKFIDLNTFDQIFVLGEILKVSQILNNGVNLTKIGGSGHAGKSKISKVISKVSDICILNQSITGLYTRELDLNKI